MNRKIVSTPYLKVYSTGLEQYIAQAVPRWLLKRFRREGPHNATEGNRVFYTGGGTDPVRTQQSACHSGVKIAQWQP
jgi:hypothetical protein